MDIELIEEQLDEYAEKMRDYYISEAYLRNYETFLMEENYTHAYSSKDVSLLDITRRYGYDTVEDLLDELYNNCSIQIVWNSGYYYNPSNKISFGYYRVDDIEVEIPEKIADMIKQVDINGINCDIILHEYHEQITGYLYICGGVSFELPIKEAIAYLEKEKM